MNVSLGHSILGVLLSSQDCSSARLWMADAIHRGCPQDSAWGLLCAHPWPAAAFQVGWLWQQLWWCQENTRSHWALHVLQVQCMTRPRNPGYQFLCSPPVLPAAEGGGNGSQQEDLTLGVITPNNLPNSCCPRWVWRSCMGRTNCGCCHEAHCPSEQKLVVSKFCWQEIPPYPPSNRSSKKLIYSILVGGFRESKLSDSFLPVVNQCKRWPIDLHLHMILKEEVIVMIRTEEPSAKSATMYHKRSVLHGGIIFPKLFQWKIHCAHLRGRSSIACDSLDAMPVYICRAQWTISKVWPLTSVCHVPTTANTVGRPKSSCTAWRRARHWSPRSAFRSHNPSSATNCRSVSGEGGTLAWTRSPMTGRKLWCIHCGSHFTVPKRAAANGIHPKCASSVSRPGNRFLALVPKPCRMAGRINSGSISMAWYILSPGSTRMVTSPGRRLRVGRAPCS